MKKIFIRILVLTIFLLALLGGRFLIGEKDIALVAVIIENHEDARPYQEGIEDALIVEEWLVEGFISRFVAVFNRDNLPKRVGPVRSLRPYFLMGLLPWNAMIFHAGGSPEALELAEQYNKLITINGISGAYYDHFERDEDIAPPHNLFITRNNMLDIAETFTRREVSWPPFAYGLAKDAPTAKTIDVNFFNPEHNVQYTFSSAANGYTRSNGTVLNHAKPDNVLILEMPIQGIGEYGRLDIQVIGKGKLLLFRAGKVYEGTWGKTSEFGQFIFANEEGKTLKFSRGQTWIMVLPTLDRVTWE